MDKPLLVDAKVDMGTEVATLVAVPSSRLRSRGPEISFTLSAKVAVLGCFESKPAADALPPSICLFVFTAVPAQPAFRAEGPPSTQTPAAMSC